MWKDIYDGLNCFMLSSLPCFYALCSSVMFIFKSHELAETPQWIAMASLVTPFSNWHSTQIT